MSGNLIIPRVEVYWGDVNLTSYNGKNKNFPQGEPVVYKVECRLPAQSNNPDATMMWVPNAAAFEIYKDLTENHIDEQIVTTFGYLGKKKVSMVWVWGGQNFSYGNSMAIQVTLLSELSGLINAVTRSTSNNDDKGMASMTAIKNTEKQYGVEKLKMIRYTAVAARDLQVAKINNKYGNNQTFVATINDIVKENGNYVFSSNIISDTIAEPSTQKITGRSETASKLVVFTPFTYEGTNDTVRDGQNRPYNVFPDPAVRYGYLLGPSMFNTMERSFRWDPPQQIQIATPAKQHIPRSRKKSKTAANTPVNQNTQRASGAKGAVQAPALAATHPGVSVQKDKLGAYKQISQQQEGSAKLTFQTFLVPALVGIKPYDIVYIPSLNAEDVNDIEDWIVNEVNYSQTDGGVEVSIQASRTYGLGGTLMNPASGQKFLEKAKTLKSLEQWESYAWMINETVKPSSEGPVSSSTGLPAGFSPNGKNVMSVVNNSTIIGSAIVNVDGSYDFRATSQGVPVPGLTDPLTQTEFMKENWLNYNPSNKTVELIENYGKSTPSLNPTAILPASPAVVSASAKNTLTQTNYPAGTPRSQQLYPGNR